MRTVNCSPIFSLPITIDHDPESCVLFELDGDLPTPARIAQATAKSTAGFSSERWPVISYKSPLLWRKWDFVPAYRVLVAAFRSYSVESQRV